MKGVAMRGEKSTFGKTVRKSLLDSLGVSERKNQKSTRPHTQSPCPPVCGGSIFDGTLSQVPDEMIALDLDEFVQLLRRLNGRTIVRKEYSKLLSPSLYDPDKAKGGSGRGKANITACAGIWLDNDTGAVTPEQFADLFRSCGWWRSTPSPRPSPAANIESSSPPTRS